MNIKRKFLLFLFIPFLFLAGCGISKNVKERAEGVKNRIEKAEERINTIEKEMQTVLSGKNGEYLKQYSLEWPEWIKSAKNSLAGARDAEKTFSAIIEENKSKNEQAAINSIAQAADYARIADDTVSKVTARIEELLKFRREAPQLVERAGKDYEKVVMLVSNQSPQFAKLSADVLEAEINYPDKKSDLEQKWQAIVNKEDGYLGVARANLDIAVSEFAKPQKDFDVIGKTSNKVHEIAESAIPSAIAKLQEGVNELNYGYEKIIHDLKVITYYIVTYYDYCETCEFEGWLKTRRVAGSEFEAMRLVEIVGSGWGSNPSLHPEFSNYYAEEAEEDFEYYVRYRIIEYGEERIGDWEKVSEQFYEEHFDDVGMAVESKPKGHYTSETVKGVRPAGYEYIGNPHYGQWKKDEQGNSFWEFYGKYAMMRDLFWGGSSYGRPTTIYRDDWNDYDSNYRRSGGKSYGKKYYGKDDQFGTFGSANKERVKRSEIYKQNQGEFKKEAARTGTVRAGGERRTRGPGGGGK